MPTTYPTSRCISGLLWLVLATGASSTSQSGEPPRVGISQRTPWTTSRVQGTPEPPLPYITERAFPALKFNMCLDIMKAPGSDRLFVVEQHGKIYSFRNQTNVEQADLVVDLRKSIPGVKQVYALTFHPDFAKNRLCYVCYIKDPNQDDGTHVARFRMNDTDPPTLDISSEQTLLTWRSGGHNGCCLKFGPDGYLYVSTGDAGPANPPDPLQAGQDVTNLLSAILRIDVNQRDGSRNYRIPDDNPFVDHRGARPEIWAYGLRNPWRMSFDSKTGDLWVGDVGWELWEMLYRVERGGNYGWAVMEGRQPTNPEWPRGPTPILPPVIDHPHSESSSITDGLTYYGSRLPELAGAHIYADYDTGKFWGFRYNSGKVIDHRELADTTHRVVGFGEDHQGEFYFLDHTAGTIHRMIPNPQRNQKTTFPARLSQTGLFTSVSKQQPAPGVIAYSINAEPWADYATAQRWIAVPGTASITPTEKEWKFPPGTVLVKTLSLDREQGNPDTQRAVETQLLHFDGIDWRPYTYAWNQAGTDATLVGPQGSDQTLKVKDAQAPGGIRQQVWRFGGRAECQRCHNKWSGPALAFNAPQLNRDHQYAMGRAGQLDTFDHINLLDTGLIADPSVKLVNPTDTTAPLDLRARAYLHVNCAHCHRLHAGSAVLSKMRFDLDLKDTGMVGVRPTQGTFGIPGAQVISPGDPFRSILYYRMSKLGAGRMPHIGSSEVDRRGIDLIYAWLRKIPPNPDALPHAVSEQFRRHDRALLDQLFQARDAAEIDTLVDKMLHSTSGAMMLLRALDDGTVSAQIIATATRRGSQHRDPPIRDLFERFLDPTQRTQRLGSVIHPEQILALTGNRQRGQQVFFNTAGVQCINCHRVGTQGEELGPDLSTIGKKYSRAQLLESILEPSKSIDPPFVTYMAETKQGRLVTGLLVKKDALEVIFKSAERRVIRLLAADIEQLLPQRQSLMPELLLRDLTAQQVADLLEFLSSLR